ILCAIGPQDPGPLVVLLSAAPQDGTYLDEPPDGGPGTAVQVYSSGGAGFCEIEHHAPLETRRSDATVAAVWGPMRERMDVVGRLCRPIA
ncbi:MAG TPA: hypothetical protein VNE62_02560, partial [Actinomycetota bacterium]|nr:hypothetical protein [Actinomycetota bacterium]